MKVIVKVKIVDVTGKIYLRDKIIDNCLDCDKCHVLPDPDPLDWFCDDDKKAVCGVLNKEITVACRPYNLRKECKVPEWCPLMEK